MLTKIVYNCSPESLCDVAPEAFVDAFENEVRARPLFRDLAVEMTFEPAIRSGLAEVASDDWEADISYEQEIQEEFQAIAEKAFTACLS